MNNEVNNNEVNSVSSTTPAENVTPVEPVPTPVETPVTETTVTETPTPVQTESAPVEAPTEAPVVEATPTPEASAEPRLVQIQPNVGGGSLSTDNPNANTNIVAKKKSIVPVIVLIVALIGLVISGFWLYNELNKDKKTTTTPEKLPFSGAFGPKVTTTPTSTESTSEPTTEATTEPTTEVGITTGVVKYPDFTGKTVEDATNWANQNGIELKVESIIAVNFQNGTIVKQSGEAGMPAIIDEPFTIYVAAN